MGDLGLVERVLALQLSQSTWTEKLRMIKITNVQFVILWGILVVEFTGRGYHNNGNTLVR